MVIHPGSIISHYQVKERLGEGAYGAVYRAVDQRLGRDVALKTLVAADARMPERVERLRREARLIASLQHPHIVTLFDIIESGDSVVLAMELIRGGTLRDEMRHGKPNARRWIEVGQALSEALSAAHRAGVVHRDVKPENVLVSNDGTVKLADFSIALLLPAESFDSRSPTADARLTVEGLVVGTPPYMSPEQIKGGQADARSDVFSLCVLLYELLTGEHPFKHTRRPVVIDAILHDPPAPLPGRTPGLTKDLKALLTEGFEKDPDRRRVSAGDMARAFRRVKEGVETLENSVWLRPAITIVLMGLVAGALSVYFGWLDLGSVGTRWRPRVSNVSAERPSLAVRPCVAKGDDAALSLLATGIPQRVLSDLTRLRSLRIVPWESVIEMRHNRVSAAKAASMLGVRFVLDCSIIQAGNRVEVGAQLYDRVDDAAIWADQYRSEMSAEDLFDVESDLASAVTTAVKAPLSPQQETKMRTPATQNTDAYLSYLRGRSLYNRYEHASNLQAIEELREAVRLDPRFADAHGALAQAYYQMPSKLWDTNPIWQVRAYEEARTAVELDPENADGYTSLGFVLFSQGYSDRAMAQIRRALELDPDQPDARTYLGGILLSMGKAEDARREINAALLLLPTNWKAYLVQASIEERQSNFEAASALYTKVVHLQPNWIRGYTALARSQHLAGRDAESGSTLHRAEQLLGKTLSEYKEMADIYQNLDRGDDSKRILRRGVEIARERLQAPGDHFDTYHYLSWMSANLGDVGAATKALRAMAAAYPDNELTWIYAARVLGLLGNRDDALAHLRHAKRIGSTFTWYARKICAPFKFKDDPEFQKVLADPSDEID